MDTVTQTITNFAKVMGSDSSPKRRWKHSEKQRILQKKPVIICRSVHQRQKRVEASAAKGTLKTSERSCYKSVIRKLGLVMLTLHVRLALPAFILLYFYVTSNVLAIAVSTTKESRNISIRNSVNDTYKATKQVGYDSHGTVFPTYLNLAPKKVARRFGSPVVWSIKQAAN